ncbi:hypothetical protein Gilli_0717 [Gillisia limnaea DSM 15749]|uniref:Uncharacterized protein n=1 Tax=Gillisia limnaea (strain DSM 15749 / LMG 21470 / R-8282) TaxID=865937 RepID=H2BSA0_GILLR|nr:hypothetical protein Gilli_0717 [Gillisia limnaea DSM 15749]
MNFNLYLLGMSSFFVKNIIMRKGLKIAFMGKMRSIKNIYSTVKTVKLATLLSNS